MRLRFTQLLPIAVCLAAVAAYFALADLKGISTDEGFRLGIMNGGKPASPAPGAPWATWGDVLRTVHPHAYQPGYYLLQNSFMRLTGQQDVMFFRLINLGFFAVCLAGLLVLSRRWAVWPRTFLVTLFAANAYLIMHVLQVREYIAAVALYIWGTWLVLRLDRRNLAHEWADVAHFVAYGLLLAAGFYLQTWTVFPAIAQGVFLVWRRRPQPWRFAAHLGLSYGLVFALTWPYLHTHQQKVDIGLWAREDVSLLTELRRGFELVLSGHFPEAGVFPDWLTLAWLALLATGAWLLGCRRSRQPVSHAEGYARQAWLMTLCVLVPLAFQIIYFYRVEPLSVWPRYFIIHYFFVTWLVALAFRSLHSTTTAGIGRWLRPAILTATSALLAFSAVYQVRSFQRDPYLDTGLSALSDWRVGTSLLTAQLKADDVILTPDFVIRSTQSFTHPVANRYLDATAIPTANLDNAERILYLEQNPTPHARGELTAGLAARGFGDPVVLDEFPLDQPIWRILAFSRR